MLLNPRNLPATTVYLILTGGYAFFFTIVISVNILFQVQEARLNPLQLVLIGTALEATIFACEVPTGVVADVYSRRRSVIIGLFLMSVGLVFNGIADFYVLLGAQVVWGLGYTFISGAQQAWIADEIGVERANQVYLRQAQVQQVMRIVAIPISIGLGTIALNIPIFVGGASFFVLGCFAWLAMSERGFTPVAHRTSTLDSLTSQFTTGVGLVRRSPLLITVFVIAAFYAMAGEGFDRLYVAHFYVNLGFPTFGSFEPVVWMGVVRMGSAILGIFAVEFVRRRVDTNSHEGVARGLFVINGLQALSLLVFALAGNFVLGMLMFWSGVVLSRAFDPLYLAWINQNIDSRVRATVMSMSSQVDALGQIAGGPMLGAIGTIFSLRAALITASIVMLPALPLYRRALGQGRRPTASGPTAAAGD